MRRAICTFKDSVSIIKRNPLIVFIAFAIGLMVLPGTGGRIIYNLGARRALLLSSSTIALFVIIPFASGGIIGIIKESTEGKKGSFYTFKAAALRNYKRLLIANIIFFLLISATPLPGYLFMATIGSLASQAPQLYNLTDTFFHMSLAIILTSLLGIFYFFQFFDVGIVVEEYGCLRTFKESYTFACSRKQSVLGFTVITLLILGTALIPNLLFPLEGFIEGPFYPQIPPDNSVGYILSTFIITSIMVPLLYSFRTVYYLRERSTKA